MRIQPGSARVGPRSSFNSSRSCCSFPGIGSKRTKVCNAKASLPLEYSLQGSSVTERTRCHCLVAEGSTDRSLLLSKNRAGHGASTSARRHTSRCPIGENRGEILCCAIAKVAVGYRATQLE